MHLSTELSSPPFQLVGIAGADQIIGPLRETTLSTEQFVYPRKVAQSSRRLGSRRRRFSELARTFGWR
jgi:hypothetical protein